ncbi:hypothetical protein ACFX2I_009553 [Malus domestica]
MKKKPQATISLPGAKYIISSLFFALQSRLTSPPVWPWRRTAPSLRSSANRRDGSRRKRRTQLKTPPSDQPREPPTSDQMHDASPIDPFLRTPTAGLAYGKLLGISRNTLKTDVVNMLDGYKLRLEDVKVDYSRAFTPMGMEVQFQSWKAFDNAARVISRKGGLYKLERVMVPWMLS